MSVDILDVDRFDSGEFDRHYRKSGRPALITGAFEEVPDWTLDFVQQGLGDTQLRATRYGSQHFSHQTSDWVHLDISVAEYAAMLTSRRAHDEGIYPAQNAIGATALAQSVGNARSGAGLTQASAWSCGASPWCSPVAPCPIPPCPGAVGRSVQCPARRRALRSLP